MKVTMATSDLKTVFDACRNFVSKSDLRPAFRRIQLNFTKKQCTACALDGIKMMMLTVPYMDGDDGAMLVPIIKLPKDPFVTLSDEGSDITFDFSGNKQVMKKYAGEFMKDPESLFPTAAPDLTIYFDPKSLRDTLDSFKACTVIELQFHGQTGGLTILGKDCKALILPVKPPKNK